MIVINKQCIYIKGDLLAVVVVDGSSVVDVEESGVVESNSEVVDSKDIVVGELEDDAELSKVLGSELKLVESLV